MELTITLNDLTPEQKYIAEVIGLSSYIDITKLFGGTYVYFPTFDGMSKQTRNRMIRREFDGGNYKKLEAKYGVSTITIRRLCDQRG